MQHTKLIISAIAGTSLMTLFSYLVSESKKKQFKEPVILGALSKSVLPDAAKETTYALGWTMHYTMGAVFVLAYSAYWKISHSKPSVKNGLLLGILSGLAGIVIWKFTFRFHPNPPDIDLKRYYGHLMLAHMVFSLPVVLIYSIENKANLSIHKK